MNGTILHKHTRNGVFLVALLTSVAAKSGAQTDSTGVQTPAAGPVSAVPATTDTTQPASNSSVDLSMSPPTLLSGSGSSLAFTSEMERSNYLRGGASVTAAYDDNVIGSSGNAASDETYSVGPFIALDVTRTRFRFNTTYAPGFTFYQHLTYRNQTDQSLALNFSYRLSPHVTFTALDSFAKNTAFSGVSYNTLTGVPNAIQSPNLSLIAPVEDTLINTANVFISYQFGRNDMVGATGNSSILRYLNRNQAPGLFDSTGEGGGGYYTHRFGRNYLGVNYLFQRLLTDTNSLETRTHSFYGSYTFYVKPNLSLSAFGGPQYSDTFGPRTPAHTMWSPSGGGAIAWQGQETSFAASFSRRITDGGGLPGSVEANIADASFRAQFTRVLIGSVGASYSNNRLLDSLFQGLFNGHTISETAGLQRAFGEHFSGSVGYLHLHQSYNNIAAISVAPNRNRVWISVSYQFERPIGR